MFEVKNLKLGSANKKNDFDDKNIKLIENSEKEIYSATLDLIELINNKKFQKNDSDYVHKFNSRYKDLFMKIQKKNIFLYH